MLTATAVITAVDRASAVFARVGANAVALSGRFKAAAGGLMAFKNTAVGNLGIPAALSVANFGYNEAEWDRLSHQYRAITELSSDQFDSLKAKIVSVSNATGVSRMELLDAAKGWAELGNAPSTFIENAEVAARTSRITGVSVAEQMKESSALLRAFRGSAWTQSDFKHFEEVYLVASKGMKGGAEAFGEAMKSWAPIAAGLGLTIEQASAFTQTLGGQFEPTEIGNALKTSFLRLAAPTPKAAAAMRYAGIDDAKLYNLDKSRLSGKSVADGLRGSGLDVTQEIEAQIERDIAAADFSKGSTALVDKLRATLTRAFGRPTKTGKSILSAQDSAIVQQALLALVGNAKTTLNPEEFFKQFAPHAGNLAFMSQVFGKEHAAKIIDLLKQMEHYSENYERIMHHSDGALERKSKIMFEGFSFELQRLQSNWQNLLGSIGGSGIKGDLSGIAQSLTNIFEAGQSADPEHLRKVFWAITALATAPLLGSGAAGLAALALAFTDLSKAFDGPLKLELGPNGEVLATRGVAPMVQVLNELKGLTSDISTDLAPLGDALRKLFDINPEGSLLLGGLTKLADSIKTIRNLFEIARLDGVRTDAEQEAEDNRRKIAERRASGLTIPALPGVSLPDSRPAMYANGASAEIQNFIRDSFPNAGMQRVEGQANVTVQGVVQGNVTLDARIQVEGGGRVTDQTTGGGAVSGKLDPGESHMDLQGP